MTKIACTLLSCLVLGLIGCSGSTPSPGKGDDARGKIIGKWWPVEEPDVEMEFGGAGNFKMTSDNFPDAKVGTYAIDGDKLTIRIQAFENAERTKTGTIKKVTETDLVFEDQKGKVEEFRKEVSGSDRAKAKEARSRQNLMYKYGLAYRAHIKVKGEAPTKAEDLIPYLENDTRVIDPLKSGDVVFIYNVKLEEMEDPGRTVLAYAKETPSKGGQVVMGNGAMRRMTAEQFKTARLARPKEK
jgi:uncharacterized protein (TIGR03066 family)